MNDTVHWDKDVTDLTHAKVGLVRYAQLTKEERLRLRERFDEFPGETTIPRWPVIPKQAQQLRSDVYPEVTIPTEALASLFNKLGMAEAGEAAHVPGSQDDLNILTESCNIVADRVRSYYATKDRKESIGIADILTQLYRDLTTVPQASESDNYPPDLLIVFGARRQGAHNRANLAATIVRSQPDPGNVRVIMSGWHPYYDTRFTFGGDGGPFLPFGEAEAMAVTFEEAVKNWRPYPFTSDKRLPRLVLDPRARNTLETIVHALPVIVETRAAKQKPLHVQLVTAPYHARRTFNIALVQLGHFLHMDHMIQKMTCAVSATSRGKPQLIDNKDPHHFDTLTLYVREAVKLIGGRLTGEF